MTKITVDFSQVRPRVRYQPGDLIDCPNPMCDDECNVCMGFGHMGRYGEGYDDEDEPE